MNSQAFASRSGRARNSSAASEAPALQWSHPREIEVHIEELVLHGFAPEDRWSIGDALERELRALLAEKGVPSTWFSSPARIDAGSLPATSVPKAAATGAGIAGAIHRGGAK